ncbi:C-terminal binding protein [Sporolactobacillus shoreicorticis]|uniref:C-terminal binding protein n=1 Tax=Sporolactobacillus shoreicorticis TaxID=1923877 RepID=A0ABW5S3Q5_9BACL|nr:C-terminal binding protein [Sporolactobacillus shoreicorticis]MCO7124275.1 C-terminal binding protein [Sporolactobacillus shoreicorticis]
MEKKKVFYYNIDDNLDYEHDLLNTWGIDNLELIEVKDYNGVQPFINHAKEADGVVVEYQQISREIMEELPNLKIIALQSIGVDNVDVESATDHGVCVTNCPGFCSEEVALHTVGLIIDLTRKITLLDRTVRGGKWDPLYGYKTHRLTGKTVGLYFFGSIPKTMMPMLRALSVKVLVFAPTKTKAFLEEYGAKKAETFEELLMQSDILSLHCPLMDSTTHLISWRELKLMKRDAFLINTARGKVVDETALAKALTDGEIRAAAVDVIEDEETESSPLFNIENTIITPHSAFISEDSFYDARKTTLKQLVQRLSKDQKPSNLVNQGVM